MKNTHKLTLFYRQSHDAVSLITDEDAYAIVAKGAFNNIYESTKKFVDIKLPDHTITIDPKRLNGFSITQLYEIDIEPKIKSQLDKTCLKAVDEMIKLLDDKTLTGEISDGFHTFDDLYRHRRILTIYIAKQLHMQNTLEDDYDFVYRSKEHHDDSMFDGYFIVVFNTPRGQYSYHYELEFWDDFDFLPEHDRADKWDGHQPDDIDRLLSFFD